MILRAYFDYKGLYKLFAPKMHFFVLCITFFPADGLQGLCSLQKPATRCLSHPVRKKNPQAVPNQPRNTNRARATGPSTWPHRPSRKKTERSDASASLTATLCKVAVPTSPLSTRAALFYALLICASDQRRKLFCPCALSITNAINKQKYRENYFDAAAHMAFKVKDLRENHVTI